MTACTIVAGPPGSGKTTYALEHMKRGDLILDMDLLYQALSGLALRDKPDCLIPFVCEARDAVLDRLQRESNVLNAWIITTADRPETLKLSHRLNAPIKLFNVPTMVCRKRMQNEGRADTAEMVEVCERWRKSWNIN